MELDIAGRRWRVTDHSTYSNAEGYHVDEWECEPVKGRSDTGYLLRESGDEERWYFTRPVPISAVALQDGAPLADVAASLTRPPGALVYRGLAHSLAETTEGQYAEDPGASVQKTTWDYWDAGREVNLAVERWPDGRVECFHGRRMEPGSIVTVGRAASRGEAKEPGTPASTAWTLGLAGAVGGLTLLFAIVGGATIETALTAALGLAGAMAFFAIHRMVKAGKMNDDDVLASAASLFAIPRGSERVAGAWLCGMLLLGAVFSRFPPLTSLVGLVALLLVPAALTRWMVRRPAGVAAGPVRAAFVAVTVATLGAGLYTYYRYASVPRSFDTYLLAVGVAPLAGLVASLAAQAVVRMSAAR